MHQGCGWCKDWVGTGKVWVLGLGLRHCHTENAVLAWRAAMHGGVELSRECGAGQSHCVQASACCDWDDSHTKSMTARTMDKQDVGLKGSMCGVKECWKK